MLQCEGRVEGNGLGAWSGALGGLPGRARGCPQRASWWERTGPAVWVQPGVGGVEGWVAPSAFFSRSLRLRSKSRNGKHLGTAAGEGQGCAWRTWLPIPSFAYGPALASVLLDSLGLGR